MINYERYVNFYTDFAFKKLFGTEANKELLISFLNALLHGKEEIRDLTYLNTEHLGGQEYDRKAVFDVYCETVDGSKILVEMQKAEQQYFKDRSIFYSTFPIRDQAVKGHEWNYQLTAVYTIGILNFCFDDTNPDYFHHEVKLLDTQTKEVFYDKLTYVYLEMPKFTKQEQELNTLFDKWLYAIKNLSRLMERPATLQEQVFTQLFQAAEIAQFNPQERVDYEASLKVFRDIYSVVETAEIRGHEKGYAAGMAAGIEQGLEQGLEQGEKKMALRMAKTLKEEGWSLHRIASLTGLSEDALQSL